VIPFKEAKHLLPVLEDRAWRNEEVKEDLSVGKQAYQNEKSQALKHFLEIDFL
jgi:hypothetical protein